MNNPELEACLSFIGKKGWKRFSFSKVSQESSIPLYRFYEKFSSPSDVMLQLFRVIDENVLKNFHPVNGLSSKDTLFDILMSRFEASEPYKPILTNFWADWMSTSIEMPSFACQGMTSMAWMLEAAGINSRGLRGLIRTQGLMAVYLFTLKTWLNDDSPDLGKTMVFLDKKLLKLERAAYILNGF